MHIPDGLLGPQTYGASYAVMVPVWALASRKVGRTLRSRQVPLLALGAAFCFVLMMFNVSVPGGTTGHAVGAVLLAVLLGPWAACIAVSIVLLVQALLFGDGGVTTLGANCFNMALVMPMVGYGVYRLISGSSAPTSWRHWVGAAAGGYFGLTAAAVTAGVMLGLQPLLCTDAAGRPLYAPYPLLIAVPAMAAGHLLLFGWIEAAVTGLVVKHLQAAEPSLIGGCSPPGCAPLPVRPVPLSPAEGGDS